MKSALVILVLVACGAPMAPVADRSEPPARPALTPTPTAPARRLLTLEGGTCAATETDLRCWGEAGAGQTVAAWPFEVPTPLVETPVVTLASDGNGFCAIDAEAHVRCWGLYLEDTEAPSALDGATDVALVGAEVCGLLDGRVRCESDAGPHTVRGVEGAVELAGGPGSGCVRTATGEASCFTVPTELDEALDGHYAATPWPGAGPVVRLHGGRAMHCALRANGRVDCRGAGGAITDAGLDGVRDLGGGDAVCARRADGWHCRGENRCGALPEGAASAFRPVPIAADFEELSVSPEHACGRRRDGSVACWGCGSTGELGAAGLRTRWGPVELARGARRVFATGDRTCVLGEDGLRCAGGATGTIFEASELRPIALEDPQHVVQLLDLGAGWVARYEDGTARWTSGSLAGVTRLVPGYPGPCVVRSDGAVECPAGDVPSPPLRRIEGLPPAADAVQLGSQLCVVTAEGDGACGPDGGPDLGELGALVQLVAVRGEWCALTRENGVLCTTERSGVRAVHGARGATALVVGDHHLCVLVPTAGSHEVRCAGQGLFGQLGVAPTPEQAAFERVPGLPSEPIAELVAGIRHTCARYASGAVWCWGADFTGQLGRLPLGLRAEPVEVPLASP